jgi:hypothetical protein
MISAASSYRACLRAIVDARFASTAIARRYVTIAQLDAPSPNWVGALTDLAQFGLHGRPRAG